MRKSPRCTTSTASSTRARTATAFCAWKRPTCSAAGETSFDRDAFPDRIELAGEAVELAYAYKPGQEEDGITVRLPYRLMDAVNPELLDWLVPGVREERITCLLRSLPKQVRKQLLPIPQTARRIAADLRPTRPSFLESLEEHLGEHYRLQVSRADWKPEAIPEHLRLRVEVRGNDGRAVAAGRDLEQLSDSTATARHPGRAGCLEKGGGPVGAGRSDLMGFRRPAGTSRGERGRRHSAARLPGAALRWRGSRPAPFPETGRCRAGEPGRDPPAVRAGHEGADAAVARGTGRAAAAASALCFTRWGPRPRAAGLHLPAPLPVRAPAGHPPDPREVRGGLPSGARETGRSRPEKMVGLVETLLETRRRIVTCPRAYPGMEEDLNRLLPAGFLAAADFERLPHLCRYLRGVQVRADRARGDAARDRRKAQLVTPYQQALDELCAAADPGNEGRMKKTESSAGSWRSGGCRSSPRSWARPARCRRSGSTGCSRKSGGNSRSAKIKARIGSGGVSGFPQVNRPSIRERTVHSD